MSNTLNLSIQEQMDVIMQSINALQQQMQPELSLFPVDVATFPTWRAPTQADR